MSDSILKAFSRLIKMPLLPLPHADEAFGSWLQRCADVYRLGGRSEFAAGVLELEGMQLTSDSWDWDVSPPPVLLEVLEKRSSLTGIELRSMLVKPSESLLRPIERDAFCPRCYQQDLHLGTPYQRREWLDAWSLTCSMHGCMLGCYAAPPPFSHEAAADRPAKALWGELKRLGRVHLFTMPDVAHLNRLGEYIVPTEIMPESWLDPEFLEHAFGQQVMSIIGGNLGKVFVYVLLGVDLEPWLDDEGNPSLTRSRAVPRARLRTRLIAAMAASILAKLASEKTKNAPAELISSLLMEDMRMQCPGRFERQSETTPRFRRRPK